MNTAPSARTARRYRLADLDFDEDHWRKLLELAEDDRRDARAYVSIVVEQHIERRWSQRVRRQTPAA